MMSRLLSRYVRREVYVHTAVGLLLFTFVVFMQDLGRAFEAAVHTNGWALAQILLYVLPEALVFTLPMALLVGLLVGLGRLGVDNELLAMAACGVSLRRLLRPLATLIGLVLAVALLLTLWLGPLARARLQALTADLASSQLSAAIQPRVFIEPANRSDLVLYTGGTEAGGRLWRHVLVAQAPAGQPPQLTLASSGELAQPAAGEIQIHLLHGAQYKLTAGHPETSLVSSFQSIDIPLWLPAPQPRAPGVAEMTLAALWRQAHPPAPRAAAAAAAGPNPDARHQALVELYRRLALAFACLALALPGLALGLRGGRGGKAGGLVLTLLLVVAYYLVFILGLGLARQGRLPPFVGAWAANLLFFAWGAWALLRLDRIPRNPIAGADPVAWFRAALSRRRAAPPWTPPVSSRPRRFRRWSPSLIEAYLVREFVSYTALLLAAFLVLVLVFTTFELISSILHNHIGLGTVAEYLLYFSPQTLYMTIPVAILMGVLITFGLMSKANEVTAVKASGMSVFRLLVPVLVVAALLAGAQFAADASWMPTWNQKQDALHAAIKGQAPQTYSNPEHKWVFGRNNDIYYFSFYDASSETFADVSVFQLDAADFLLRRRIFARQARWDRDIGAWIFTDGWERSFGPPPAGEFQRFQVASFGGLTETPAYFRTDSRPGMQMSYGELSRYIQNLRRSGYDVGRLSVTLAQKITYPLASIIMVLLAFPFALSVGRRGTVAGISIGIGVAIAYWSAASLLQALGNLNQMPALMAAWAPDVLFMGAGVYLLLRVPT